MPRVDAEIVHAALTRYVEEVKRLVLALDEQQVYEERYIQRWAGLVATGRATGANETERRAKEAELLTPERGLRDGARIRVRRSELWLQAAHEQLATYRLLYGRAPQERPKK